MSRFDIYALREGNVYVIDVQSDFLDALPTRLVVPLIEEHRLIKAIPELNVSIHVEGRAFYTVTNMLAAMPLGMLGKCVGSAEDKSYEIVRAIDFLLQGF